MKKELIAIDNIGKIYPASMNKKWNMTYRISAYMTDDINVDSLKQAVCDLAPRFPTFYVQLYKGFCWAYFKKVSNYDIVVPDKGYPCRPMLVGEGDKPLFRVLYGDKKISAEFFHALSDGSGSGIYLRTLIARYLELNGYEIEKGPGIFDYKDEPSQGEMEDTNLKVYSKEFKGSRKEANSYQYKPERKKNFLHVTDGIIPIDKLKEVTKAKYGCTITEYLTGVYAYSFFQQYLKDSKTKNIDKPIKISVPINSRSFFESETIRNFSSFVNVDIDPKTINTLPAMIGCVREKMADMIQKDKIQCAISQNVAVEKVLVIKYAPYFIKRPIMKMAFYIFGERKYTSPLSNVGIIKVTESMKPHVKRFAYIICETPVNSVYCTAVGYGNLLTVTISAVTENTEVEDFFFSTIKKDGIDFEIEYISK